MILLPLFSKFLTMNIKLFESRKIRSEWNEQEQQWYFSVVDVIGVLTESPDPKDYWYRIKKKRKDIWN